MTGSALARELVVVATDPDRTGREALRRLGAAADGPGILATLGARGVPSLLALSDRGHVAVAAVHGLPDFAADRIRTAMAETAGVPAKAFAAETSVLRGREAVAFLFRWGTGFLGGVPGDAVARRRFGVALDRAETAGSLSEILRRLAAAIAAAAAAVDDAARPQRWEAALGDTALAVAADVHGQLSSKACLLIGAGAIGEALARRLQGGGLGRLVVTGADPVDADAVARRLSCHVAPAAQLDDALAAADIIITAEGGREAVLTRDRMTAALAGPRDRPLFLIDTGAPGDIAPDVDVLPSAFRYTIADLEARSGIAEDIRRDITRLADRILADGVRRLLRDEAAREEVAVVKAMREKFLSCKADIMTEEPDLSVTDAMDRMIDRIVADPQDVMRIAGETEEDAVPLERVLRRMFRLPDIGRRPGPRPPGDGTRGERDA